MKDQNHFLSVKFEAHLSAVVDAISNGLPFLAC